MRLTTRNIDFVRCHTYNGIPYSWMIVLKDRSSFHYNVYLNGETACIGFPEENLPASVQEFISTHNAEQVEEAREYMDGVIEDYVYE